MQIQINAGDRIRGSEALTATMTEMIEAALSRFSTHVTRVEAHLSDENGSKGQQDKRCVLEARMEGRKPVAVVENATHMKLAVQGALDKLVRMLDKTVGRMNEHRKDIPELPSPEVE